MAEMTQIAGRVPQWDVGDRLRKALTDSGWSVARMAGYLEVDRNTVGNYINGRTRPRTVTLRAWAMATGVSYEWLSTGAVSVSSPDGGERTGTTEKYGQSTGARLYQWPVRAPRHCDGMAPMRRAA